MIIKGFWHILLKNHWYSIVTDQLRILLNSGLYEVCEEINIGCLGTIEEKQYLEKYFINNYPKLKLRHHSTNETEYEYATLRLIENIRSNYVGLYFHTKAATNPNITLQNHWRAWLNEEILNLWESHYYNILDGYDISGVNYLEGYNHYSGNFYWFSRGYIDKLRKIDKIDLKNRWGAEQWICSERNKKYNKESIEPSQKIYRIEVK